MKSKHKIAIHQIDYHKFNHASTAFQEWLNWITCMAAFDVGIYD